MMNLRKKRILLTCLVGTLLGMPTLAFAGSESGLYLGAGIGEINVEVSTFDESDTAYKVFGGYNFGVVPFLDLAIEASYVDFGNPGSGPVDIDLSGLNAFGLVGFKLGPVGLFAKAGMIAWDAEISIDDIRDDDTGTDPAYGVGARLQIGSFAIRAEYELYDISDVKDLSMLSASAVYTF
jgi:outer membrane immunogenic protein